MGDGTSTIIDSLQLAIAALPPRHSLYRRSRRRRRIARSPEEDCSRPLIPCLHYRQISEEESRTESNRGTVGMRQEVQYSLDAAVMILLPTDVIA